LEGFAGGQCDDFRGGDGQRITGVEITAGAGHALRGTEAAKPDELRPAVVREIKKATYTLVAVIQPLCESFVVLPRYPG
jgi:hypothetical protein